MILRIDAGRALQEHGLNLHCEFVYYASREEQRAALEVIRRALLTEPVDRSVLTRLEHTDRAAGAVRGLLSIGPEGESDAVLREYLQGLAVSLERELERRAPLRRPPDVARQIRRRMESWDCAHADDLLEVRVPRVAPVWANCVALRFSPRWEREAGNWDRDTQFMFEMNFVAGLFIWLSVHVVPEFRGRRIGVSFVASIEELARNLGFRRFAVPGPNPGFWKGQFGYALRPEHDMGSFVHEVYRED
jgi:GNAT superfamily N-acetyltransferase